jgi:ribosome biogenesis GTPase A
LDSPGVIPLENYSMTDEEKIAQHVKVGGRSYNQVKEPELALNEIVKTEKKVLEKFYKIKFDDAEDLVEKIGMKRSFLKKGGEVNTDQAARSILKDWQLGKIEV